MNPSASSGIPIPPEAMRARVAGTSDPKWFDESGALSVLDLERGLASIGKAFAEFPRILDWGCGCGRILRHLPRRDGQTIHGCDIDREALDWVTANLPWVTTACIDGLPPTPYPDASFDLVINHSVMTHLDATYQDAWLAELRRIVRPGGTVILTVSGQNVFAQYLAALAAHAPQRAARAGAEFSLGIHYTTDDDWGSVFPDFYHSSFHSVEYVFRHWQEFLSIRSYIPRGALLYQDMVVLQAPSEDQPLPKLHHDASQFERMRHIAARMDDQAKALDEVAVALRQMSATADRRTGETAELLVETRRLTLDLQAATAARVATEASLQSTLGSTSWKVTAPLRALSRWLKPSST